MEITNRRSQYSITETKNDLTVKGEVTVQENGTISSLSGNIQDQNGTYCGDFYYGESQDNKINKNLTNIESTKLNAIETLIAEVILGVKEN